MLNSNKINTVTNNVFRVALANGDNIAISCNGNKMSYSMLNKKALQVAALLTSRCVVNQNIGILTQRTFSSYYGLLGTLYAGCVYVPLNPRFPLKRILDIVKNANISTIIFDESEDVNIKELLEMSDEISCVIVPERDLDGVAPLLEPHFVEPDDLAYIMYTSGSTGDPKGVMVTHSNVCSHIGGMNRIYQFTDTDKFSQTFDLSFDPSVSDIFCAWFNAATLCVLPAEEIYCVSEYINREQITFWASVPTLANFMIKLEQLRPGIFPSLKWSTFCGEPLPQTIAHQWSDAAANSTIENLYGPTEATVYISRYVYKKSEHSRKYSNGIVPIGLPLPDQRAAIIDNNLQLLSDGKMGELCVSGSQVTQGYLNDKKKTDKVFVSMPWDGSEENRWYRTGDLAFINDNGDIECLGRIDSQIKIAGQRMELGEIEAVVREMCNTSEAAVIPVGYEHGTPSGVVAFVAKKIATNDIVRIRRLCSEKLLPVFVPKEFHVIDSLPLTLSGKIDRNALKNLVCS